MLNEKRMQSGFGPDCDEKSGFRKTVYLRPHHGLCLGFFEGYGYSDGFCRNMAAVLNSLKADTVVRLAEGLDDICANCPNRDSGCPNAKKYDGSVLRACGLATGQELTWTELTQKIRERVTVPGKLEEICGDCKWISICRKKEYEIKDLSSRDGRN